MTDDSRTPRPPVVPGPQRRRLPQWPIGVVLAGIGFSLLIVATNHFRRGTVLLALSVVLATVLRAVLPERRAGLLVVRSRLIDCLTLGALAVALVVLSLTVPRPS